MTKSLRAWSLLLGCALLPSASGGDGVQIKGGEPVMFANGVTLQCGQDCRVRVEAEGRMSVLLNPGSMEARVEARAQLRPVHLSVFHGSRMVTYKLVINETVVVSGQSVATVADAAGPEPDAAQSNWYGLPDSARGHLQGTAVGHRIRQVGEK